MKLFSKKYHKPGTIPGTLNAEGNPESEPLQIKLVSYNQQNISIEDDVQVSDIPNHLVEGEVAWINIEGHLDVDSLVQLGQIFKLHQLALEDVLNTGQRPKVDSYDEFVFMVMNLPKVQNELIEIGQISFFYNHQFLITVCQNQTDVFDKIMIRLNDSNTQLRMRSSDFLLYTLVDAIIDEGFPVLERYSQQIEEVEELILTETDNGTLEKIYILKRELIMLRHTMWPQRDLVNKLLRNESGFIKDKSLIYMRDCYDHTVQLIDLLESFRELTGSMLDTHLSSSNSRTNEVMRILTIISTIFIPLTFIVGVYGMNFNPTLGAFSMPELTSPYGYLIVWIVMIIITVSMVFFFRRKKWL